MRPPLKWAGGKYAIIERLREALPAGRRLIEPFVGSAVVFLNLQGYGDYVLADANPDLIRFYTLLQTEGPAFVERCRRHFGAAGNTKERYYELRDRFNETASSEERAALLLYLNRHGFNGLYRVSRRGVFNVPYGRIKAPLFPEEAMLLFHRRATRAKIVEQDFELTMAAAGPGDVVYCDPPYVPLSATAHFAAYAEAGFGAEHQRLLAEAARAAAKRGATVVLSNHHNEITEKLYCDARIETFSVQRFISRDGANRGRAPELLAVYEPG